MQASRRPILVLTRIWPTAERPGLGSFIRARTLGVPGLKVIRPRWPRAPWPIVYAEMLASALWAGRIGGVEAHMLLPTGLVGLVVARLRGVPLVVLAHGTDARDWDRRPAAFGWLARQVARRADRLIANSADTANHLRRLGGRPVVITPGIDLQRFHPTPRPRTRRTLYLGGRDPAKGHDVAAGLADTLVGPWLSEVSADEVARLMREHDIVLVPSKAEGFGLVAVEAIASGRWVVASDVGGLREIVIDGVNGTLVRDGDFASALAAVPDYDPDIIAASVARFDIGTWQAALRELWDGLAGD